MSLKEQLDTLKGQMKSVIPEAIWAEMERHVDELRRSGLTTCLPKVGERAPTFTLPSSTGELIRLENLLARGPVVLSFYRGRW